ncbi:hypothetical protein GGP73_002133 [Salinibacter ruber]|nr:hypothetical protein [Salinibacter ruber]
MWATLLFVPFTSVQVAHLGITGLAAFQLFGVLFIFRCLIDAAWTGTGALKVSRATGLAALFLFICIVSISMAALKAGTVDVLPASGQKRWPRFASYLVPLELSISNFTQVLYPTFGVFLFHFLVRELRSFGDLKKAINVLVWGALITAGFSIASGILYTAGQGNLYLGLLSLFTVGPISGVGAPDAGSFGQFFRSYTPAGEPGFTAITLLVGSGLLVGGTVWKTGGRSPVVRRSLLKLTILAFALLLNGSTTGYFGVALLIGWVVLAPGYIGTKRVRSLRPVLYAVGGVAIVGIVGSVIQVSGMSFYRWLTDYHLAKLQGESVGSGSVRFLVTWYALTEVFLVSPILGVGYGSHLSLSLFSVLLSNVGLVGFGVFAGFLFVVFRNATRAARRAPGALQVIAFMALLIFVPLFGTLFVAKATSAINYGLTWTVIALTESSYQVYRRSQTHSTAQV